MKNNRDSTICWPLLAILCVLCIISCVAIKCATPYITKPGASSFWIKQVVFYGIGAFILFFILKFTNDRIYSGMWIIYGVLMIFLVGLVIERIALYRFGMHVIPFAKDINGATSWYNVPGFSFQPSEFMKIIMIVCNARIITEHNEVYEEHNFENDLKLIGKVLAISLPPMALVYLQNDAGVTLIMFCSIVFILFASGIQKGWYILGVGAIIVILLIASYLFIYQHDIFTTILTGHKLERIYGWLDPEGTYRKEGFQLFNAMMAYGTAGLFGHGFSHVVIALQEAQTDFIFAVITLGFGFVGGIITILAILIFDCIIIRIGLRAKNQQDKYFIAGLFGCLIFQQVWNIAMILGLLPITGITLPFISYGGSSLLSYMIAMGMCMDIHRQTSIIEGKNRYQL